MRLDLPQGGVHLGYCTNIHPGETWEEVFANLQTYLPRVKARFCPDKPFGVGLRLSAQAAESLLEVTRREAFKAFLAAEDLYVFTMNGFPYGSFHGTRVKEDVYLPDWRSAERVKYTLDLAEVLADLLPPSLETGTISTVPLAYKAGFDTDRDTDLVIRNLKDVNSGLRSFYEKTGKRILLALEPEPCCVLETIDEAVAFFDRLGPTDGYIGICYDLCHAAVEFADPREDLHRMKEHGIRVHKIQVTAGLICDTRSDAGRHLIRDLDDAVFLHQVLADRNGGIARFPDIGDAIETPSGGFGTDTWRLHFHVPVYRPTLGAAQTTQDFAAKALALAKAQQVTTHFEVETYTWDVLPKALQSCDLVDNICRELDWSLTELMR